MVNKLRFFLPLNNYRLVLGVYHANRLILFEALGDNGHGEGVPAAVPVRNTERARERVLIAWIVRYGEDFPRLITCYIPLLFLYSPRLLPTRLKSIYPRSTSVRSSCTRSLWPTSTPSEPLTSFLSRNFASSNASHRFRRGAPDSESAELGPVLIRSLTLTITIC